MRTFLEEHITGKKIFILFLLTNIVYAIMLLVTIPKAMTYAGGMKLLDIMPGGYDIAYINTLFEALGESGRDFYLKNQMPFDMIYPVLFGISYCLLLAYLLKKLGRFNTSLFYFCLLPLLAGIADYLENFGIIKMLNNYPDQSLLSMNATNVFTIIKSGSTTTYFVILVVSLLVYSYRVFIKKMV